MEVTDFWPLTLLLMCSLVVGQIPEPVDSRQSLETSRSVEKSEEEVEDKDYGSVSLSSSAAPGGLLKSTPSTSKGDPEDLKTVLDDNFHMFRKRRSAEEEEEDFEQESYVRPVLSYQQMFLDSQELQGIREKLKQINSFKSTHPESHPTATKEFSFLGIVERIYLNNKNNEKLQKITYTE